MWVSITYVYAKTKRNVTYVPQMRPQVHKEREPNSRYPIIFKYYPVFYLSMNQIVPVIDQFVDAWEARALDYYKNAITRYDEIYREYQKIVNPDNKCCYATTPEQNRLGDPIYKKGQEYLKSVAGADYNLQNAIKYNRVDEIQRMLHKEAIAKKQKFITNIEKKAGNILDGQLYMNNGEINGVVIGDKAKVSVDTISAGGYNIQCFHYRTLVKVIK